MTRLISLRTLTAATLLTAFAAFAPAQNAPAPAAADGAKPAAPPRGGPPDGRLPNIPAAVSSFGAAIAGESVYVYSGHIGKAHDHSKDNLANGFWRLDLKRPREWESLPMRTPLQGLAMVAWNGKLVRIGGVNARNAAGEKTDMHSTADVELFDPETKEWTPLTPLPEPRSSFDAVVLGNRVYVVGGWKLSGEESTGTWHENDYSADLSASPIRWEPLPKAPFKHRALSLAATERALYAIGGLDEHGDATTAVWILDLEKKEWKKGPDIPSQGRTKAFGSSAFAVDGTVWASAADGKVFSITDGATEWRDANYTLKAPRFFHRILPHSNGGALLFLGGAGKGGHFDSIEQVELALLNAPRTADLPAAAKAAATAKSSANGQANWTGFRGDGSSHTHARNLPLKWSDNEGIAWNVTLTGYGQSSPVVWGDRIFVTAVEGDQKEKLLVSAYDLKTGDVLWTTKLEPSKLQKLSDYISKAAPTPVVDANRVVAFFETGDLVALDHTGKTLWNRSLTKEYGDFLGNHGVGASLTQSKDDVFVLIDHDGPSYLLCLDKKTGANKWKIDRPKRVSWSTPLVVARPDGEQIIISSSGSVEAFAAADGRQLWSVDGLKMNNVPSPTLAGDLVVIGSTERNNTVAVHLAASLSPETPRIAWRAKEATCNFGSPLVVDQSVYCVNKAGVAFANDLKNGDRRWSLRLPDSCWASPIAAGDTLYFFSKNGATTVLRDTPNGPERIAENTLTVTGRVYGVAAIDNAFIIRTGDRLVRIGAVQ